MSHALIARNSDLRRLETEGYTLRIVDDAYLSIENVPYVAATGEVHEGVLVMALTLSGDRTVPPTTHVAHWGGGFPYDAGGNKLVAVIRGKRRARLAFRIDTSCVPAFCQAEGWL